MRLTWLAQKILGAVKVGNIELQKTPSSCFDLGCGNGILPS